jgi:hypothetical protein
VDDFLAEHRNDVGEEGDELLARSCHARKAFAENAARPPRDEARAAFQPLHDRVARFAFFEHEDQLGAYFSDRGRPFQADRGRRFIAIMDDRNARE